MKRFLLLACLATALAAGTAFVVRPRPDEASAVSPSQVVGGYKLKLKGDGWVRGTSVPYRAERIAGNAVLTLTRASADPLDRKLKVEIRLDQAFTGGLLDLATPDPAFVGEGFVVGDSMTVIDTGGPTFVNVLTLQFLKDGGRMVGHWVSSYPAADPDSGPASAVGIDFTGRHFKARGAARDFTPSPRSAK
jgi:hypothetical protein